MTKRTKSIKEIISSGAKEVAPETKIEKLDALYFNINQLLKQPEPLYRLDMGENRVYYRFVDDNPVFYTSVTTLIKKTLPTSPFLIKWMVDKQGEGKEEAHEKSIYGSFLHQEVGSMLITGKYNLDTIGDRLRPFLIKEQMPENRLKWSEELKKDILSFAQFAIDRELEPLAIELVLYHPTDGYAGALDIVGNLSWNKKRIRAVVDVKSGKKNFYESHEIQLKCYWNMWNIHFPNLPVDAVFNWSPKDYRTATPTYNFKDQSDSKNLAKLPFLVELARIEAEKFNDKTLIIKGQIDLTKGISVNIEEKYLTDLIREYK